MDSGKLKLADVKQLIKSNPGITNVLIASRYGIASSYVLQYFCKLDGEAWLFVQWKKRTKHYFMAEYAAKHNLVREVPVDSEATNNDYLGRDEALVVQGLSAMWKVPKGAV